MSHHPNADPGTSESQNPDLQDAGGGEPGPADESLNRKRVFTEYFQNNYWRNKESVSGPGSTLDYTENIRKEIPKLLQKYGVKIFLDAPCGDYNWFRAMERPPDMQYIGGDIVDELIKQNQAKYGDRNTRFLSIDVANDALPPADLWMCRDCLFHFSYADIFKTLANFLRSDISYLLTSVHPNCTENVDVPTGGARQLNLELPPFSLRRPILCFDDWIPGYTVRQMGLWTKPMVADSLASNPQVRNASFRPTSRATR